MPKLTQTIQPTPDTTVDLAPEVITALRPKLAQYQTLHAQIAGLKQIEETLKAEIGILRDSTGEMSIELDGIKITLVGGTQKKLNKKRLIALGCAATWLEEATEIVPKKAYEKITLPNERDSSREESDD